MADIATIGIAFDTSQVLTGSRQVQTAMQQVVQAEQQAATASATLARSSTSTASALTEESRAASQAASSISQVSQSARAASTSMSDLARQALAFGASQIGVQSVTQALGALKAALTSAVQEAVRLESLSATFKGISGSARQAGADLQFVRETANRLGLSFTSLADGYKSIAAAARGTALEGATVRQTFQAISEASRVFGLSAEQTNGALLALSQMISKGTVSAEELRGQLGERLPGAFQIAARAMGVTTAELGKMLEKGELLITDFLPKFNRQIKMELGDAAAEAAKTAGAEFARFDSQMQRIQATIGQAMVPALTTLARHFNRVTDAILGAKEEAEKFGKVRDLMEKMTPKREPGATAMEAFVPGGQARLQELTVLMAARDRLMRGEGTTSRADQTRKLEENAAAIEKVTTAQEKAVETQQKLNKERDIAEADQPFVVPGAATAQKIQSTMQGISAQVETINRQQQAGMPVLDALNAKIKVYEQALEKARASLAEQPGTFQILQRRVQPAIDAAQKQLTLLEKQKDAITGADAAQRKADQEREQATREVERRQKEDTAASLKGDEPFLQQVADAADLLGEMQRRTERLKMTEEERFAMRVKAMAEERPYLKEELEAGLKALETEEKRVDALKERNKLLQEQAQVSAARLSDIQRLEKQLEPRRRTMSTAEQHAQTLKDLETALGPADEATRQRMAQARERSAKTLEQERAREQFEELEKVALNVFDHIGDAIEKFTQTGKFNFKEMIDAMLADFMRFSIKSLSKMAVESDWLQGLMKGAVNMMGSTGGGQFGMSAATTAGVQADLSAGFASGAIPFQHGGPVYANQTYMVGERGPELFVPKSNGQILPNGAGMPSSPAPINVYITTPDIGSFRRSENQIAAQMAGAARQARRIR